MVFNNKILPNIMWFITLCPLGFAPFWRQGKVFGSLMQESNPRPAGQNDFHTQHYPLHY